MFPEAVTLGIAAALGVPESRRAALQVRPGASGGNSRVFFVMLDGRTLVAKQYFRHPSDVRDRLQAEWAFLQYAAGAGIGCVPRPVARDNASGIGVYEYVAGRNLTPEDVSGTRVQEAAAFFRALNEPARRHAAASLAAASEACFSIAEHVAMVDGRISRLATISRSSDEDLAARTFAGLLEERWHEVRAGIMGATRAAGHDPGAEVEERCISPSDFGFHNALLRDTGELCFLDFEYAGWDDPAKMAGDFFAHPGVPVPHEHFDAFTKAAMGFSRHAAALEARARLLEPVFRIKWCCIVLNEFVPEAAQRRRFALPGADAAAAKRRQLDKARGLLASV
jgi:hypothetical protein